MGIKAFNHGDDFVNKLVKAIASDSTGLDATPPPPEPEIESSGGTSFTESDAGFKYHIFTGNGTFTVGSDVTAYVMLAGGGGGGGIQHGGGGGGGALYYNESLSITSGSYTVSIGDGGAGSYPVSPTNEASPGSDSAFGPGTPLHVIVKGGGSGGNMGRDGDGSPHRDGNTGGCGGGGGMTPIHPSPPSRNPGGPVTAPPTTPTSSPFLFTSAGGRGNDYNSEGYGGGGGGAAMNQGSANSEVPDASFPRTVGAAPGGEDFSAPGMFLPDTAITTAQPELGTPTSFLGVPAPSSSHVKRGFCGGGGGGSHSPAAIWPPGSARESGGTGGVGNNGAGSAGTTNRGGGGGGSGGSPNAGGAGGKGVCIIKFPYQPTFNFTAMEATGGSTYTNGDYKIHVFTSPGTFTVNTVGSTGDVEYVIVGGGGGGGGNHAGGGGAGGFLTGISTLTAQGYPISIGAGGAGTPDNGVPGTQGGPSTFNSITAQGGGAGSGDSNPSTILNGGSGGGGHRDGSPNYGLGNYVANGSSSATDNQGNPGGAAHATPTASPTQIGGGGGGGASTRGETSEGPGNGGSGGAGGFGRRAPITFISPSNPYGAPGTLTGDFYFAGGGGGGTHTGPQAGGLGRNGGGDGGGAPDSGSIHEGHAGTVNTGGGGGGGGISNGPGAAGGSGIVMIAYRTAMPT